MATSVLSVPDISCAHCEHTIINALTPVRGIKNVRVREKKPLDQIASVTARDERAVLGFFEGHDQAGRFEIALGRVDRMAERFGERDAEPPELTEGVMRKGADVVVDERQSPRVGPPGEIVPGGEPVEIDLGEPAAVIVAGAQKQNRVILRHAIVLSLNPSGCRRVNAGCHRQLDSPVRNCTEILD